MPTYSVEGILLQHRARVFCSIACEQMRGSGVTMKREERDGNTRFLVRFSGGQIEAGAWMIDPKSALVDACKILGGRP